MNTIRWRSSAGIAAALLGMLFVFAIADELPAPVPQPLTAPEQWDSLEKSIRDGVIAHADARLGLQKLKPLLESYFWVHGGTWASRRKWAFPVEGYGIKNVEKYYVVRGFDFFDSVKTVKKRSSSHPAYDIFIRDKNQDLLDDRTGKPVRVLSMSAGIVAGKNTGWQKDSILKGGNYVWVYDPCTQGLFYYAHLNDISVSLGDVVKPGTPLGTVGRTGRNAYKKRSPTHLHIMYLQYPDNGYPVPKRIYEDLAASSKKK